VSRGSEKSKQSKESKESRESRESHDFEANEFEKFRNMNSGSRNHSFQTRNFPNFDPTPRDFEPTEFSNQKTPVYPSSSNNSSQNTRQIQDSSVTIAPESQTHSAPNSTNQASTDPNLPPTNGNVTVQVTCTCDSKIIKFGRRLAKKIHEIRKTPENSKDEISDHDKLLSHTKILEMIPQFMNLTKIYLSDMNLTDLPIEFQQLEKIEFLALNKNKFRIIPEAVTRLPRLHTLYLHNNKISDICRNVENMKSLKFLGLQFNRIKKLPPHLFRIQNLKYLNLSNNLIDELPNSVSNVGHSLKGLWLSNNDIETLPLCVHNLKKLVILHVDGNRIRHVPRFVYEMNLNDFVVTGDSLDKEEAVRRAKITKSSLRK